jgi:hypothetical protein
MTLFLRKNRLFFYRVVPILNSTFFKSSKSNSLEQITKIYQKLPKKISKDGGDMQDGVWTFFLYENMSCDRYFRSFVLIFGLSHYFLTFNHTKINFEILDRPNMGLSYKILINKWLIHVILLLLSASVLVFVLIGFFTLLTDKKISKFLEHLNMVLSYENMFKYWI